MWRHTAYPTQHLVANGLLYMLATNLPLANIYMYSRLLDKVDGKMLAFDGIFKIHMVLMYLNIS